MRWGVCYKILLLIGLSVSLSGASGGGCGGENLFDGLADDDSRQAKIEAAQIALNKDDCQTALNLFTEVYGSSPTAVKERIDLSAAYLCRAGFKAITLVDVAADFKTGDVGSTQLFNRIADRTVVSLDSSWQTNISSAKTMLAASPITSPPTAYNNNPDAAFNLAVVVFVEGVLTVVDILNFVDGVVSCSASQGAINSNCQIDSTNFTTIVNGLQDASSVLSTLGLSSSVTDSVNTVLTDLRAVDGVAGDAIVCSDLDLYLANQGIPEASCI